MVIKVWLGHICAKKAKVGGAVWLIVSKRTLSNISRNWFIGFFGFRTEVSGYFSRYQAPDTGGGGGAWGLALAYPRYFAVNTRVLFP